MLKKFLLDFLWQAKTKNENIFKVSGVKTKIKDHCQKYK